MLRSQERVSHLDEVGYGNTPSTISSHRPPRPPIHQPFYNPRPPQPPIFLGRTDEKTQYDSMDCIFQEPGVSQAITNLSGPSDLPRTVDKVASSAEAIAAWKRFYGPRQIKFGPMHKVPFECGRTLGKGGLGIVVETQIDGVPVAWKRTYSRKLTDQLMNEVKVLNQMSERRHKHVVEMIGSYVHEQKRIYELGLLIWPVAQCDLSMFLLDIDALTAYHKKDSVETTGFMVANKEQVSALESISTLLSLNHQGTNSSKHDWSNVYQQSIKRLKEVFGCVAQAISHLHHNRIRHKDFKPSQVLLSPHGTWLTDFGWSNAVSETMNDTTSGGDAITAKYHAPERAVKNPCGRPEDIFALGCSYLEMAYRLMKESPEVYLQTKSVVPWSFQAHLESIESWLLPFRSEEMNACSLLGRLIKRMLAKDPKSRPPIDEVLEHLRKPTQNGYPELFGQCCRYRDMPGQTSHTTPQTQIPISNAKNSSSVPAGPEGQAQRPQIGRTMPTTPHVLPPQPSGGSIKYSKMPRKFDSKSSDESSWDYSSDASDIRPTKNRKIKTGRAGKDTRRYTYRRTPSPRPQRRSYVPYDASSSSYYPRYNERQPEDPDPFDTRRYRVYDRESGKWTSSDQHPQNPPPRRSNLEPTIDNRPKCHRCLAPGITEDGPYHGAGRCPIILKPPISENEQRAAALEAWLGKEQAREGYWQYGRETPRRARVPYNDPYPYDY